jgi:phenylalanyl-tRNA synthetase beta chain
MNISYNWLRSLVSIDLDPRQVGEKLTSVGLAVEGIEQHGDDFVFDIDLTSNRPDCLSHLGVARELAAALRSDLKELAALEVSSKQGEPGLVTVEDTALCQRFTARIISNVKIGPSPAWLVDRLEAVGERSINNVADITNFVMLELGQPMHAFDIDKLEGSKVVVRKAKVGEQITTLDGAERVLGTSMLAICDARKPIAIAGIMGGLDTSITEETRNVLLEVAYFSRENIRSTSRALNLATEASYRFERGVDIENLIRASERATQLICELAGGTAGEFIDVYPSKQEAAAVRSEDIANAVKRLTSLDCSIGECNQILDALGINQVGKGQYQSPSWRHDIVIEEDLVEEVARHLGLAAIAPQLPPSLGAGEYQPTEAKEKLIRQTLVDIGFNEAITYSFIPGRFDDLIDPVPGVVNSQTQEKYVTLQDSVIEGSVRMRPTVVPGLLDAVRLNLNHQRKDLKLFEIGKVFAASSGEVPLPNEVKVLTIVMTGTQTEGDWSSTARELDFFDLKGAAEAALNSASAQSPEFRPADVAHLRSGQAAEVLVAGSVVGYVGRLGDELTATYKFRQNVFIAELNLDKVLAAFPPKIVYKSLSKYPGIIRDITLLVPRALTFEQVRSAIREQKFELCRNISFVDFYEGKGVPEDQRSLTIRLEYRSDERTLVEEEVESVHTRILESLGHTLGVGVRY